MINDYLLVRDTAGSGPLEFGPAGDDGDAIVDAELIVDRTQMLADGAQADEELLGDQLQHLNFAVGEAAGMPWPAKVCLDLCRPIES